MEYIEKTLTAIITHGTNSITFTDDFITNESIIDVYFSSDDIVPTNQEQIGNRLIISIEPKNYDISIAVHITNDDTINYADELESLSDTVEEHATAISDITFDVVTLENNVDTLENNVDTLENKVDGLNANNISYDEHSTLYSAMGDIDSLETESKNLVGAINEVKESGGGGGQSYSTTEQVIGTWIDGKPLYKKTYSVNLQASHTASLSNIEVELPLNLQYNVVSRIYGCYNAAQKMPIGFSQGGIYTMSRIIDTNLRLDYSQHPLFNNATVFVTIEYTKSTD